MKRVVGWLAVHGSLLLFAFHAGAGNPPSRPVPPGSVQQPDAGLSQADREVQQLLNRLTELGNWISQNAQSAQAYRYQMAQADVMLQLGARSKAKERDDWLRMAVDSYYSASLQSPDSDPAARQRLTELPAQLGQAFPGNPVHAYAALQVIRAEHVRTLEKSPESGARANEQMRDRLLQFARDYATTPDAPKAVLEAGQLSESLGKPDEAKHCYRELTERFPSDPLVRKAGGALWRLGLDGQPVHIKLPLLFASGPETQQVDLQELRGALVVVYFWSSTSTQVAEDFQILKQLTDRYQYRGLEVLYVNLDSDPTAARTFLSGRLTAGIHLHQAGGLDSPIAERFGLQSLPQVLLVGRDGTVLRNAIRTSQIEGAVTTQLSGRR
jgi:hypothetical protein